MAKRIRFSKQGFTAWITRNTSEDALSLRYGKMVRKHKVIPSFKALFDTRTEREGKQIAKDLLSRMCELLAKDLVEQHDIFILPKRETGYLRIGRIDQHEEPGRYRYDIRTDGVTYGGLVILDELVHRVNGGKRYFFKLTQPWIRRIRELRSHGRTWD